MRYESARQSLFDEVSATVSVNRQDDGRLEQQRPGQRIDSQVNTTTAMGYTAQATKNFSARYRTLVGGEIFDEQIDGSRRFDEPNGSVVRARPDIPDGTKYRTMGVFLQQSAELTGKLSVRGGLRYGHYKFTSTADPTLGVPGQEIPIGDTTFNAGAVYAVTPQLTVHRVGEPRLPRGERVRLRRHRPERRRGLRDFAAARPSSWAACAAAPTAPPRSRRDRSSATSIPSG